MTTGGIGVEVIYRARVGQCDRLLGAFFHDLGNVVLPQRGGAEADDSELGRMLRTLRRQSGALADHLMEVRGAADALRARAAGDDPPAPMSAGDWWATNARFFRAMLRHGRPIRLVVDEGDEPLVAPRRIGRPLMLCLVALDVRYDPAEALTLTLEPGALGARFGAEAPLTARTPWPRDLTTDLEALGARVVEVGADRTAGTLLSIALPDDAITTPTG